VVCSVCWGALLLSFLADHIGDVVSDIHWLVGLHHNTTVTQHA
jgi:hypothetical protein